MRVLFLSGFYFSGQTTHTVELAKALSSLGHTVSVLTRGRAQLPAWAMYQGALKRSNVDARRCEGISPLIDAALAFRPDVVHCHSSTLLEDALQIGRRAGAPVVFTAHGLGVHRFELRRVDWVIAVGPRVADELRRAGVERLCLIGNGVDLRRFKPQEKARSPLVAYVGRVDATKRRGLAALIEATRRVGRLHVASNDRPPGEHLTVHGWLPDVAPLLGSAHVVVGTGRAIREGMASGCVAVVLGAKYAGIVGPKSIPEGAFPSFSGEAGVTPSAPLIERDLIALFQNRTRLETLGRWSRKYALRHFSLERMAASVLEVYARLDRRCIAL